MFLHQRKIRFSKLSKSENPPPPLEFFWILSVLAALRREVSLANLAAAVEAVAEAAGVLSVEVASAEDKEDMVEDKVEEGASVRSRFRSGAFLRSSANLTLPLATFSSTFSCCSRNICIKLVVGVGRMSGLAMVELLNEEFSMLELNEELRRLVFVISVRGLATGIGLGVES